MQSVLNKRALSVFLASICVGVILAAPGSASALHRRYHASACYSNLSDLKSYPSNGVANTGTTSTGYLTCEIDDDSYFEKEDIATLNIHVYDAHASSGVCAYTCVTYWDSNGGACNASPDCSSSTGNDTLSPARTYWTSDYAQDFGYILVSIPVQYSGSSSSVRGYYIQN